MLAHHDTGDLPFFLSISLFPFDFFSPRRLVELPIPSCLVRVGTYLRPFLILAVSSEVKELQSRPLSRDAHKDVIAIITIITVVIAVIVSPRTRAARKVVPDGDLRHFRIARLNVLAVSEIVYTLFLQISSCKSLTEIKDSLFLVNFLLLFLSLSR